MPLSRHDGSMGESVSESVRDVCMSHQSDWISYKQPQISCCKGKWYMRRSDPDIVQNGHIYSSIREEDIIMYWAYFNVFCGSHRGFCGQV